MGSVRGVLIRVALVLLCWWLMMATHELGHVLSAVAGGGTVEHVELAPWTISRTDRHGSAHPLLDVWMGPLVGTVLPLLIALLLRRPPVLRSWAMFFAGFCAVANGLYIGLGWIDGIGDTGDLLRLGTPVWPMPLFGVVASGLGLSLWHRELERRRKRPLSDERHGDHAPHERDGTPEP